MSLAPDHMEEPVPCPWCGEWVELQDTCQGWDEDIEQDVLVCTDCERDGKPG